MVNTTLPPLAEDDLGTDVSLTEDLAPVWGVATGKMNLGMALYRRLTTSRGRLFYDAAYGYNLTDLLNAELSPADLSAARGAIIAECEKDERVQRAMASLTFNPASRTLAIVIEIDSAEGPFDLVLRVTSLTVDILRLAGQDVLPTAARPDAVVVEVGRLGGAVVVAGSSRILWLESDSGVALDEWGGVTGWTDQSSEHNIVAPLGTELFTVVPNVFGDQPGLVANVAGSKLAGDAKLLPTDSPRTVFVVVKCLFDVGDQGRGWLFLSFGTVNPVFSLGAQNIHGNNTIYPYCNEVGDAYWVEPKQYTTHPVATFADVPRLLTYRFSGSGKIEFAVDGEDLAPLLGTDYAAESGDAGFTIGGFTAPDSYRLLGALGAIIAYDTALSDAAVDAERAALATKYGLTL